MSAIIIPDIHQKTTWKMVKKSADMFDKIFFVGDYYDHHGDAEVHDEEAVKNFL